MTEEELADAIAQGRFGALSLDTSVFDQFGCNLDARQLLALGPLATQHEIKLVLSEVTRGEVQAHIRSAAVERAEKLRAALNQYRRAWRRKEDLTALAAVDLDADPVQLANDEWDRYAGEVGLEIVDAANLVSAGELVRRYFSDEPPFAKTGGKKAEFPDAIALLSLEAWAEAEDTLVLVISRDGDWRRFADGSTRLVSAQRLDEALDHFNAAGRKIADRAAEMLSTEDAPDLKDDIDRELASWLSEADFEVEANSDFYYESQPESADVQTWNVISDPKVLSFDGEVVTFSLEIDCLILFIANFSLSVFDGIDREYVGLNSQNAEVEERHKVTLAITVQRNLDPEPYAVEVQANRRRLHADFGYVGLDWGYEE